MWNCFHWSYVEQWMKSHNVCACASRYLKSLALCLASRLWFHRFFLWDIYEMFSFELGLYNRDLSFIGLKKWMPLQVGSFINCIELVTFHEGLCGQDLFQVVSNTSTFVISSWLTKFASFHNGIAPFVNEIAIFGWVFFSHNWIWFGWRNDLKHATCG